MKIRVAIVLLSCIVSAVFAQTSPSRNVGKVVWSDEFNGDRIDAKIWTHDVGGSGWGNGQLEFDTDLPGNTFLENGRLIIQAKRENYKGKSFTSGRMHTRGRFAFQYGTLEARIKMPNTNNGLWPAFWMLGHKYPKQPWPHCGEIDIVEVGHLDGLTEGVPHRRMNAALHFSGADEKRKSIVKWTDAPQDLYRDFHRFRLEWTPKFIAFALDGEEFARMEITAAEMGEYHQPFYPLINLAVGSRAGSYTSANTPDQVTAKLPARLEVDWIRLTANQHTKIVRGAAAKKDSADSP